MDNILINAPKVIKIGPYDYTLQFRDDEWSRATGHAGQCDSEKLIITIYDRLSLRNVAAVFIHEVMEAFQHQREHTGQITPHQAIEDTEWAITEVFARNPEVLAWWVKLITA